MPKRRYQINLSESHAIKAWLFSYLLDASNVIGSWPPMLGISHD